MTKKTAKKSKGLLIFLFEIIWFIAQTIGKIIYGCVMLLVIAGFALGQLVLWSNKNEQYANKKKKKKR